MTNKEYENLNFHAEPKYIVAPLEIKAFIRGQCFICGEKCLQEFYVHFQCAISYENKKKEILDDFFKKEKIK